MSLPFCNEKSTLHPVEPESGTKQGTKVATRKIFIKIISEKQ